MTAEFQKTDKAVRALGDGLDHSGKRMAEAERDTRRLERTLRDLSGAQDKVTRSAGAMRAASMNLGYQISDVTQQIALGTNPLIIFAQQGGQTAAALAGMGGTVGKVAGALSGPWGAAVMGAVMITGTLASKLWESEDAANDAKKATDSLTDAEKRLKEIRGESILTAREHAALTYADAQAKRTSALATLSQAEAELEYAKALYEAQKIRASGPGQSSEIAAMGLTGRLADIESAKAAVAEVRKEVYAASQDVDKAFGKVASGGLVLEDILGGVNGKIRETKDSSKETTKALREQEKAMDALADAARRASNAMSDFGIADAQAMAKAREDAYVKRHGIEGGIYGEGLGAILEASKKPMEEAGKAGAKAFRDEGLLAAEAIGQAIGGSAGNALKTVAGVLQGVKSGDYTGVSGPAGGIMTLLSGKSGKNNPFKEGMKEAFDNAAKPFKSVAKEIGKSFGLDGAFTKTLGKAFGGAAVGTATSGVMKALGIKTSQTGAQIGGAIGGITGIPGGEIIGSVLGGVIGGMLKKVKWGAADLTGGDDYGIRGNSAKAKGAAGVAADSFLGGLQSIADALGADLGKYSVTIGQRHGDWRVNTTAGGSLKKKKGAHEFDDDAEGAIKFAIRDAIRDGALLGISAFSERVLKGNTDLDKALDLATKYEQVLDALGADANGITAAAKDFTESFQTLAKEMQKVGATAEELANVEKLYGIEREKAMQSLLAPLLDYQKALSGEGSGVTALERMKAAQVDYEKAKADFAAGKVDQGVVTGAGQQYFGLARDVLGTANSEFQSIRQQLIADSAGLLETARNAFNAGAPDKLVAMQETANTIASQAYQQQVISNQYLAHLPLIAQHLSSGGIAAGLRFVNGKLMAA